MFEICGNRLVYSWDKEQLWIEPWGEDSLRVRATKMAVMPCEDWALLPQPQTNAKITARQNGAEITNGKITARINRFGKLTFFNADGEKLLEEFVRNKKNCGAPPDAQCPDQVSSPLEIEARELRPITGGDYELSIRFESDSSEKLYGMGQYQQPYLNMKGSDLELAHRNSQVSIPFVLSDKGYGFLWNNPAVGRAVFAKNRTTWQAYSAKGMDYWITASKTPAGIMRAYAQVTGFVPMMPDYAMGFWQSKLRYQTQEELLEVAREYKRRNLPISVIVIDFFHWTCQGEWKFDKEYWPDPEGMVRELKSMGIELMVSVWPTVDTKSENFREMLEKGYLIQTERGLRIVMTFNGNEIFFDPTNEKAREYVWNKAKKNYYDAGIHAFWLDVAEPEYGAYEFDHYRYHLGSALQVGNVYPLLYAKTFYDGMSAAGQRNVLNLIRSAWAGSQRYGSLVWSGDIDATFDSLREQVTAGLSMGLSGIPWWTTDIGGFLGGNPEDEDYRELFVRWFQYASFCPVMRLHGYRDPHSKPLGTSGGGCCDSGAANEVWSYGEKVLGICEKYMRLRERMKDYISQLMTQAHENGAPVIRPLFFDFPDEAVCWTVENQFMFGPDVLAAPVLYPGAVTREVYLPAGSAWTELHTGKIIAGGQTITADAPLDVIPVFTRNGRSF